MVILQLAIERGGCKYSKYVFLPGSQVFLRAFRFQQLYNIYRLGPRPYDRKADRLYDRGTGSNIRSKDESWSGVNRKQMEIVGCHPSPYLFTCLCMPHPNPIPIPISLHMSACPCVLLPWNGNTCPTPPHPHPHISSHVCLSLCSPSMER